MNPVYTVLESPQRWLILTGLSLLVAVFGAIMLIAYDAPHTAARIWFYVFLLGTLYCSGHGVVHWKAAVDDAATTNAQRARRGERDRTENQ